MLTIYRRHTRPDANGEGGCEHVADPYWKKCRCPMWIRGTLPGGGPEIRETLKTRSWEKAEAEKRRREDAAEDPGKAAPEPLTVQQAIEQYLMDAKDRECGPETLDKLRAIFQNDPPKQARKDGTVVEPARKVSPSLLYFSKQKGVKALRAADLKFLREWRSTWLDAPLSRRKKQERVIGFFYFCMRSKWITENPALNLGTIKVQQKPTDYFNREEFQKLIEASYRYPVGGRGEVRVNGDNAQRLRALMLLMRYSGLAIQDAVTLPKKRISESGEVMTYRTKNGNPVWCPLPDFVIEALRTCPGQNEHFYFWSGDGKPKSAVKDWQRAFRKLFKLADLRGEDGLPKRAHPHMIRDTFAVELLLGGAPVEEVAMLMGHSDPAITIKHYAPWVKSRQEKLSANVRRMWAGEVALIQPTKDVEELERMYELGERKA